MQTATESLPEDANALKAMLIAERVQNERLRQIIKELQRHRFGRRRDIARRSDAAGLEEIEQTQADVNAATEQSAPIERAARISNRRMNRGSLASHLPRIEMVIDIARPARAARGCFTGSAST